VGFLLLLLLLLLVKTGGWKQARRWRLLVVDSGSISFADLYFRRQQQAAAAAPSPGHRTASCLSSHRTSDLLPCLQAAAAGVDYAVSAVDTSRAVADHVVMLTWPPDGRYSPLRHTPMPGHHSSHQHEKRHRFPDNSSSVDIKDGSGAAAAGVGGGGGDHHSGSALGGSSSV